MKALLDHSPKIFNWIKIWTLSKPRKPLFAWNAAATFDLWGAALSSCSQPSPCGNMQCIVGIAYLLSICTCVFPVTEPWSGTIGPTPCHEMQPQTPMHMTRAVSQWLKHKRETILLQVPAILVQLCSKLGEGWFIWPQTFAQSLLVQLACCKHHSRWAVLFFLYSHYGLFKKK